MFYYFKNTKCQQFENIFPEFLGLSRVNVSGFVLSQVLEILFIDVIHYCYNHMAP